MQLLLMAAGVRGGRRAKGVCVLANNYSILGTGERQVVPRPSPIAHCAQDQGAAEKVKRENDVHLRQLAKKQYVRTFFFLFFFFSAFWGVSRQESLSERGVRKHEEKK
jgi:hypothetical protein